LSNREIITPHPLSTTTNSDCSKTIATNAPTTLAAFTRDFLSNVQRMKEEDVPWTGRTGVHPVVALRSYDIATLSQKDYQKFMADWKRIRGPNLVTATMLYGYWRANFADVIAMTYHAAEEVNAEAIREQDAERDAHASSAIAPERADLNAAVAAPVADPVREIAADPPTAASPSPAPAAVPTPVAAGTARTRSLQAQYVSNENNDDAGDNDEEQDAVKNNRESDGGSTPSRIRTPQCHHPNRRQPHSCITQQALTHSTRASGAARFSRATATTTPARTTTTTRWTTGASPSTTVRPHAHTATSPFVTKGLWRSHILSTHSHHNLTTQASRASRSRRNSSACALSAASSSAALPTLLL
jgi:hypothetical protein